MSNLNCRPGDLAVVARVNQERFENILGAIVQVTSLRQNHRTGKPCWNYEGKPLVSRCGTVVTGIDDDELRPILPPPGSVTDSEVLELYSPRTVPVPTKEHAT